MQFRGGAFKYTFDKFVQRPKEKPCKYSVTSGKEPMQCSGQVARNPCTYLIFSGIIMFLGALNDKGDTSFVQNLMPATNQHS